MKKFLLVSALAVSVMAKAQVKSVSLQAGGLTCSMCSNAINKALKKLSFVAQVEADIKTYRFGISFTPSTVIDFDLIRSSVENAGFTVAAFYATVHFNDAAVTGGQPMVIEDKTFLFVNTKQQVLNGEVQVKIIDKGFVSAKEFSRDPYLTIPAKTYHVSL